MTWFNVDSLFYTQSKNAPWIHLLPLQPRVKVKWPQHGHIWSREFEPDNLQLVIYPPPVMNIRIYFLYFVAFCLSICPLVHVCSIKTNARCLSLCILHKHKNLFYTTNPIECQVSCIQQVHLSSVHWASKVAISCNSSFLPLFLNFTYRLEPKWFQNDMSMSKWSRKWLHWGFINVMEGNPLSYIMCLVTIPLVHSKNHILHECKILLCSNIQTKYLLVGKCKKKSPRVWRVWQLG